MKISAALLTLSLTAHAQLIPFLANNKPTSDLQLDRQHQRPMADTSGPGIQLPPSSNNDGDNSRPNGDIILSDVMGTQPQVQIFAGFTRDIDSVATRLDTSSLNTTVLAPLNKAITSLPRKPWEDPRDYGAFGESAYSGQDGEDRAHRNLRRFTETHVVPMSPWKQGEKVQSLGGSTIWWEKKDDGTMVIKPVDVEIEGVVSRVANGEVWVVKQVLNYA